MDGGIRAAAAGTALAASAAAKKRTQSFPAQDQNRKSNHTIKTAACSRRDGRLLLVPPFDKNPAGFIDKGGRIFYT